MNAMHEQAHALWNCLADFSATEVDAALACLTQGLCVLVNARSADWVGAARRSDGPHASASESCLPPSSRVLRGLLTGQSEKEIAADFGRSYHTTHEYVTAIYRKFGVNNRAGLMALWLGRAA